MRMSKLNGRSTGTIDELPNGIQLISLLLLELAIDGKMIVPVDCLGASLVPHLEMLPHVDRAFGHPRKHRRFPHELCYSVRNENVARVSVFDGATELAQVVAVEIFTYERAPTVCRNMNQLNK